MFKKKSAGLDKAGFSDYAFMIPGFIIYISVIVAPVFYSLYISLFDWNGVGEMKFLGLDNYIQAFTDPIFLMSLKHQLWWVGMTLVFTTLVSLGFAVLLTKNFKGRTFFRGYFYFPSVIALIAVSIIWRWIYNADYGFINQFLKMIGVDYQQAWISQPSTVLICCFIAAIWQGIGQNMIFFIAGLQGVSVDCLEAATIDGCNGFQRFVYVTVPLMKNTFIMVIATEIIAAMKVYDIIAGLTNGGPNNASQMLATYMYSNTFQYARVGYGTTIACLMLLMMLIVIIPYTIFTAKEN